MGNDRKSSAAERSVLAEIDHGSLVDILMNVDIGISIHQNRDIVFANKKSVEMHGYTFQEASTTEIRDYISPEEYRKLSRIFQEVIDGKRPPGPFQFMGRKNGRGEFPVEIVVQVVDWKGSPAILATEMDVSIREQALSESSQLGEILESSLNEIYVFDIHSLRFLFVNRGACENLGYSREELLEMSPMGISPQFDIEAFKSRIQPLYDGTSEKIVFQSTHRRKDESVYDVEIHLQHMQTSNSPVFAAVALDITERLKIKKNLRRTLLDLQKANRARSRFIANMSHELRTPLNSIIGFSQLMSKDLPRPLEPYQLKEYAQQIEQSGTHLLQILNDILDLVEVESGNVELADEDIDLIELLENSLASMNYLTTSKGILLNLDIQGNQPVLLLGDPRRFRQIFTNLLSNAIKFSPPNSKVDVTVCVDDVDGVKIIVVDQGCGIDEDKLENILEPFIQGEDSLSRVHEGVGLGLPLSKFLTELHEGTLTIESEVGAGTSVTVLVPGRRVLSNRSFEADGELAFQ